jgi:phytoene dehydrogenase-like protein
MADMTFDAVVVGGGSKGIVTALYLAAYGGMSVGIFEGRHELGGGWASDDAPAPGFIGDSHCASTNKNYFLPLIEDFPDFGEKGGRWVETPVIGATIFAEDQSSYVTYGHEHDPTGEKTAAQIARFSEKDAETWLQEYELYWKPGGMREAILNTCYNLPPKPGEKTAYEEAIDKALSEGDKYSSLFLYRQTQDILQRVREKWESIELRADQVFGFPRSGRSTLTTMGDMSSMPIGPGESIILIGGTHTMAHAVIRMFLERGGKFFSRSPVEKVLIENGKATGIRLANGTEVAASKLVVTNVSPYQLCFELVGGEHFSPQIMRKIKSLKNDLSCITWYTWAIHERADWKAAEFNPDVKDAQRINLAWRDDEAMIREELLNRLGDLSGERQIIVWGQPSLFDPTRAPNGKHTLCTEQNVPPAYALTEREWMEYKKRNAEETMNTLAKYTNNMTWDNVIGYNPITPYDTAAFAPNFAPAGGFAVVDNTPCQVGRFRPIPELADHRVPGIKNLYPTGAAWPPEGGGHCCAAYNCYKAIAEDLDLGKPWKDKGRSW